MYISTDHIFGLFSKCMWNEVKAVNRSWAFFIGLWGTQNFVLFFFFLCNLRKLAKVTRSVIFFIKLNVIKTHFFKQYFLNDSILLEYLKFSLIELNDKKTHVFLTILLFLFMDCLLWNSHFYSLFSSLFYKLELKNKLSHFCKQKSEYTITLNK